MLIKYSGNVCLQMINTEDREQHSKQIQRSWQHPMQNRRPEGDPTTLTVRTLPVMAVKWFRE